MYMSDYKDYASQLRLKTYRQCGHYPLMSGSPCANCCEAMIREAMEKAIKSREA